MSLTKFIAIPDVKERLTAEFSLPATSLKGPILAPPITKNYGLVGTAFDYMMRFYLERLNPGCEKQPWVAEQSVELTKPAPRLFKATSKLLDFAKESYRHYLETGGLDDDILSSTIFLAQLDVIYRAGILDPDIGKADPGDLKDLRNLIGAVDPNLFKAQRFCMLNPTFGEASLLVGGADADIVIDATLIDIKTTKKLGFTREQFNQLVGYYVLNRISGRMGSVAGVSISKLGVYYSRYGLLHLIPVDFIEKKEDIKEFVSWFIDRAKSAYPEDRETRQGESAD
ncbi:MAG: hypothetical protein OK452_11415 [Thaumarchaeota archaeon]|nr:hypothetical protein [Nitrososphaerota archaeon]